MLPVSSSSAAPQQSLSSNTGNDADCGFDPSHQTSRNSLDPSLCSRITDEGLKQLARLTNRNSLDLRAYAQISDAGLERLSQLPTNPR